MTIPELNGSWLLVTTPPEKQQQCKKILEYRKPNVKYLLIEAENRGRDILPLFKNYDTMIQLGVKVFCKLHSKISHYRTDGHTWRKNLFTGLLNPKTINSILSELYNSDTIGIVLPNQYTYSLKNIETTSDRNFDKVQQLAKKLDLNINRNDNNVFPAGSMFWSKIESLIPMHRLCVDERLFEEECGAVDETFAHACERLFSLSAKSIGLDTADIYSLIDNNNE